MQATVDETEEETRRRGLDEAANQIVVVLPRLFKTVMRQARDSETLRGAISSDMGDAQVWTLHALMRGPLLASELARRSNVTNPTMTRIVDALVEKGFVERHPDPEDRRRIHLRLTPAGTEIGNRVHECFRDALANYLAPLSDDQLTDIRRAFAHLRSLIHDGEDWCKAQGTMDDGRRTMDDGDKH